jgi:deoxyribodipyrimidine photolyase
MKTSTPKESPKKRNRRKKTLSKLRSKLRYTEKKLLVNLKKRLKRLEMMAKRKQVIDIMEGREVQKKTTKRGQRTSLNNSQRRLMRKLVSHFLH